MFVLSFMLHIKLISRRALLLIHISSIQRNSQPKNGNFVIIYSPSCISQPAHFFLLVNTKWDILKNVDNQRVSVSID